MPVISQIPILIKTKKLPVPYYKDNDFCLYNSDSIELMKLLQNFNI